MVSLSAQCSLAYSIAGRYKSQKKEDSMKVAEIIFPASLYRPGVAKKLQESWVDLPWNGKDIRNVGCFSQEVSR